MTAQLLGPVSRPVSQTVVWPKNQAEVWHVPAAHLRERKGKQNTPHDLGTSDVSQATSAFGKQPCGPTKQIPTTPVAPRFEAGRGQAALLHSSSPIQKLIALKRWPLCSLPQTQVLCLVPDQGQMNRVKSLLQHSSNTQGQIPTSLSPLQSGDWQATGTSRLPKRSE